MTVSELAERLTRLEAEYQTWYAPIRAFRVENLRRVNRDGYTFADLQRDEARRVLERKQEFDPFPAIERAIQELCENYRAATPEGCLQLRAIVADKPGIQQALMRAIYASSERIHGPADTEWLELGLAAACLEDFSQDYRDTFLALAELYVSAERAGLPVEIEFQRAAAMASAARPKGGGTALAEVLANFSTYAVVAERRRAEIGRT